METLLITTPGLANPAVGDTSTHSNLYPKELARQQTSQLSPAIPLISHLHPLTFPPLTPSMISSGRKYRSKKERPCDLCRSRKIQCKLLRDEAACEICKKLDRQCTFVLAPLRRKHPVRLPGDENQAMAAVDSLGVIEPGVHGQVPSSMPVHMDVTMARESSSWQWPVSDDVNFFSGTEEYLGEQLYPEDNILSPGMPGAEPVMLGQAVAVHSPDRSSQGSSGSAMQDLVEDNEAPPGADCLTGYPLEGRKGYSNELIGLSSESDPYLLRHYLYHQHDTYTMFRLDFHRMADDKETRMSSTDSVQSPRMPIQFVMTNEDIYIEGVKAAEAVFAESSTESSDSELLNSLVSADLGSRLVKLYARHVHPQLPVLSLSDLAQIQDATFPVGLRSAVYALAAPFAFLDDELSLSRGYLRVPTENLWAIAHRSFYRAGRLSHITTLQLALFLLQMPPAHWSVADPPGIWALSCSSVGIAESLGLNLDPSDWRLPRKEITLRRRLWWLTYTQHTWQAVVMGRASHINDANWDVSPPTLADFDGKEYPDPEARESIVRCIPICLAQCHLAMIVADVLKEFYTLKAVRESPSLDILLARAQPLRARIEAWRQTLPFLSKPACDLTEDEFDTGASLRLSHLTLEILIYRALLRPLSPPHTVPASSSSSSPDSSPISTILENSFTGAKVATEIISALKAKHFAAFWPSYTRNQLCYTSTFILLNLAQSPTRETALRNRTLLNKWRHILRTQSQAWPVARLATIRLDAVFWKGLSTVLHGTGPGSAAYSLVKDETGIAVH